MTQVRVWIFRIGARRPSLSAIGPMPVDILLADAHHELSWLGTRCAKGGFFEVPGKFY
jgi:hypothetical protein